MPQGGKMKILHIINNLQGGGAEKMISDIIPILNKSHDVSLLLLNNNDPKFYETLVNRKINIHILRKKNILGQIKSIKTYIKSNKFDIVHVHLFPSLYLSAVATIGIQVPLIYTEHSTSNKRREYKIFKYLERLFYSRYSKIICISHPTMQNLKKHLNCPKFNKRLIIIPNGVILPEIKPQEKHLSNHNQEVKIIMVGRFERQKDHVTVIKAMEYTSEKVHLYFAGTGSFEQKYKTLVKQEKLESRIHFLGFVNNITEKLKEMDIAILSSNWEGFGLAAVESMAIGLPTIGSNVPGLSEVIDNGGLLFKKGDERELAQLINDLIDNKELYNLTSRKGIEKAQMYDINNMINEYKSIYNNATQNSNPT